MFLGIMINNDDWDWIVYGVGVQVMFEFFENYCLFVCGGWNKCEYDSVVDDNGFN